MMARPNTADSNRYLDSNNRLSSAGAAQSLKYARPQDLPSYPTSGLPPNRNKQDATTAATLGWQNQKSYEPWKPETSGAAATAATRGWGTTAPKQWQPEQSMSGARAAVLAAQRNKNLPAQGVTVPPPPQPRPSPSAWGNTAANLAVSSTGPSPPQLRPAPSAWGNTAANLAVSNSKAKRPGTQTPPNTTYRPSEIDRHGSLMAATGAMANGPRRRADSSPAVRPSYPDQANARTNALRAATAAQTNSQSPKVVPQGGASPAVIMPRGKFGYNPGSQPVVDEKQHQDALQSSAVAMAQQMYKIMEKNKNDKEATAGASGAMGRNRSLSLSSGSDVQPMRFNNLHDQAQILAARRLADMHDEEAQSREYREYYAGQFGPPPGQSQPNTNRFSLGKMFSRNRRNSNDSMDDDVETRKIRAQMAVFQSSLSKMDNTKRQSDRDHLLAIAQRNVQRDLKDIDQQVYTKTGKPTPQMTQQRQREAYERQQAEMYAQQQHEERMQHFGQIDIGGGNYMQQEQIDEAARRNIQPVLDDIDVHNKERIEADLDAEEKKRQAAVDREREKESKALEKTMKQQMKDEAKAKKEEEKLTRKQSRKGSRLSRFGSISRSTDANQPAAASASSPESSHVVQDAPPVLAPVPATQPLSLSGQSDGAEDMHHMSSAVRTSTTDTERATRESMGYVSAAGDPSPAVVAPVAPAAPVEPAAVPLPRHDSDTNLAEEANQDMRNEIPVSETEYDPYLNHTAVPTSMSMEPEGVNAPVVPIVPFDADNETSVVPTTGTSTGVSSAPAAPVAPAQNTTSYDSLPAATPPAKVLQKPLNTAPGTNKTSSPPPVSPTGSSPKEKKGVKGWLKKAFRRGSSSVDNDAKLDRKASKRMSKISKEDPKGKKPVIGSPTNATGTGADAKPTETTNIGLGKEDMGKGNLTQKEATQPGTSGSGGAVAATSGPLDSHPDVHAVDRSLYDATPPAPGDQRQSMIDYERDQERARDDDEIAVSDIDSELDARTRGKDAEQDASTVSMLSEGSMERKRRQELEYEQKEAAHLPKVKSDTEMEKAAEREEREEIRREERDEVDSISPPKFPTSGIREGSPARETRFHENV